MKYNSYSTNESNVVKEAEYMIEPSLPLLSLFWFCFFSHVPFSRFVCLFVCWFCLFVSLVSLVGCYAGSKLQER
jgi:hypothetical protein